MNNICLRDVRVFYENGKNERTVAIDGITVDINANSINCLIGYSGCGKTTLAKVILGLLDYEGEIYLDNVNFLSLSPNERRLGYISQNYLLYPHLTIFDNIAFPLKVIGAPREEIIKRVEELANDLGISFLLSRKPKHLSGGQQQCVALARALIKTPSFIVLDEPLSNFDAPTRVRIRQLIKKALKERNIGALYITHDLTEAMAIADTIYVMDNGKIIDSGLPLTIFNKDNAIIKSMKESINNGKLV